MIYSEWLLQEFPELADSSSVKRFNYIKQAKAETKRVRFLVSTLSLFCSILLGYCLGYIFKKYTNAELWVVITIVVAFSILFSPKTSSKIEQNIIQKKLIELVGKST